MGGGHLNHGQEANVPDLHRQSAPEKLRCAVITVSDTRTVETDRGGAIAAGLLEEAKHVVVHRAIIPDDRERIRQEVFCLFERGDVDVVLLTGGTGLSPRDQTVEAVEPLFTKSLPGFGELFRMLSFHEIGPAAMLSRACAGVIGRMVLFLLPGSPGGVKLALEQLILPELGHIVYELRKGMATA
ncbi:MAG: MogA/MoaB family molybdenum cofactor biosynthesis protein [Thermoguttaceae bacterium]|nr:MogA/MoaB family molybdenum cofactor biosynthesis protein [Thermoguttaceae bacterium]MDW8079964.1 MogA/MoaB family molybdenum cofactor biosynthesis protein [Thermoguttaceae bacterium]